MSRQKGLDLMFGGKTKYQTVAHKRSPQQELELAIRGMGKLTPGSGNKTHKGDVKLYNKAFRIEAKCTKHKSFSVTRAMIEKIEDASLPNGELPAIVIEFLDDDGNPVGEVAVVPTYVLDSLNVRVMLDGT